MRQNQSDFDQFSWHPAFSDIIFINGFNLFTPTADFLFQTLKLWFYGYMQPANIAGIHFGKPPQHKGKKTHTIVFTGKNFIYNLWLVTSSFLTCEENHPTSKSLCGLLKNFFLFWQI